MTITRKSAKAKGTAMENAVVTSLLRIFRGVERRVKMGKNDKGDTNVPQLPELVLEVKNTSSYAGKLSGWLAEAEAERINAGALIAAVWHKRVGKADADEAFVTMTGKNFKYLLAMWAAAKRAELTWGDEWPLPAAPTKQGTTGG